MMENTKYLRLVCNFFELCENFAISSVKYLLTKLSFLHVFKNLDFRKKIHTADTFFRHNKCNLSLTHTLTHPHTLFCNLTLHKKLILFCQLNWANLGSKDQSQWNFSFVEVLANPKKIFFWLNSFAIYRRFLCRCRISLL